MNLPIVVGVVEGAHHGHEKATEADKIEGQGFEPGTVGISQRLLVRKNPPTTSDSQGQWKNNCPID